MNYTDCFAGFSFEERILKLLKGCYFLNNGEEISQIGSS